MSFRTGKNYAERSVGAALPGKPEALALANLDSSPCWYYEVANGEGGKA